MFVKKKYYYKNIIKINIYYIYLYKLKIIMKNIFENILIYIYILYIIK